MFFSNCIQSGLRLTFSRTSYSINMNEVFLVFFELIPKHFEWRNIKGIVKMSGSYEFSQSGLISEWVLNASWSGEVAVLFGNKGVGKSNLIYKLSKAKPDAILIFTAIQVGSDIHLMSAGAHEKEHVTYAHDHFWLDALPLIHARTQDVVIAIDNADLLAGHLGHFIQSFTQLLPVMGVKARLLLVGSAKLKKIKQLSQCLPLYVCLNPPSETECGDFLDSMHAKGPEGERSIFRPGFVRHISMATRGNLRVIKRIVEIAKQLAVAEQSTHLSPRQEKLVLAAAGLPYKSRPGAFLLIAYAVLAMAIGWGGADIIKLPFPTPQWLDVAKPVVKESAPAKITEMTSNVRDAMQQLFATWGYDVSAEEAWCEQADRADLICDSGNETGINKLANSSLPWIARLNVEKHTLYAVVMRISDNDLDLIVNKKTWTVSRHWFDSHSEGHYIMMWPPAPDGKNRVTNKSSAESIIWLDAMLSRALGVPANESGDWTPTLTEKVKLFQRNEKLQQDGVPGKDTLIRLRQALGEAPRLINETTSGTDLSTWPTSRLPPDGDKQSDVRKEKAK